MPLVFRFSLMLRRPPTSTRTYTRFPSTTLFRSAPRNRSRPAVVVAGQVEHKRLMAANMVERPCRPGRSEEHTSELQSLKRISYAVFCMNTQTTIMIPTFIDFLHTAEMTTATIKANKSKHNSHTHSE